LGERRDITSANAEAAAYEPLRVLMNRFGARCTPQEFYWAVNRAYHAAESLVYDDCHADLFESLGVVWQRLLGHMPAAAGKARLEVLDVGCGTGLVAEMLAANCPDRVGRLMLLDPCGGMLEQCRRKSNSWPFECDYHEGDVFSLGANARFDVITANSVLHHVVELRRFCVRLAELLRPGGVLLTAQDERRGAAGDRVLRRRRAGAAASGSCFARSARRTRRLLGSLARRMRIYRRWSPLAAAVSGPLLEQGVIRRAMDLASINAVVDFHISGQPGALGRGIDPAELKDWLTGLSLRDYFTYAFRGLAFSLLTQTEQKQELTWLAQADAHGAVFASAWRKGAPRSSEAR